MNSTPDSITENIEIKVVGKSGQISLGKRYAGKTLRLERRTDGTVVLTAVAMVPENQLWTLREPHRSRMEREFAWAAVTKPRETGVDDLLNARSNRGQAPAWPPRVIVSAWT